MDERSETKLLQLSAGEELRARRDRSHGVVAGAGNIERIRGNGPAYGNRSRAAQESNLPQTTTAQHSTPSSSDALWSMLKEEGKMEDDGKLVSIQVPQRLLQHICGQSRITTTVESVVSQPRFCIQHQPIHR